MLKKSFQLLNKWIKKVYVHLHVYIYTCTIWSNSVANRDVSAEEEEKGVAGGDKSRTKYTVTRDRKGAFIITSKGRERGPTAFLVFRCSFQEREPSSTRIQVSAAL